MALQVPRSFLAAPSHADRSLHREREEPEIFRLPPARAADLRDVARGVEETNAGVCCRYLYDQLSASGPPEADPDEVELEAAEKFCERNSVWSHPLVASWRRRVARCRAALRALREAGDHGSASALMVAFGHPDPFLREVPELVAALGADLAPLARYSDAVEERRTEAARRAVAGETDLSAARARRAHALSVSTSAGALRDALRPYEEPHPVLARGESPADLERRREARRERKAAHEERRDRFVVALRLESARMLSAASRAYHAAWLAAASTEDGYRAAHPATRLAGWDPRASAPHAALGPCRERGPGWSTT